MRLRTRLLHVLVLSAVIAFGAVIAGPSAHAQAAQSGAPTPIAVAIDPGHGGGPTPSDPSLPWDPGAIGGNGVVEKNVTLDVANRAANLLRADLVDVSLTRTDDRSVSIDQREQVAIDAHAAVFVSIHCNSYAPDSTVGGSLVLYPNDRGLPLANALSGALGRDLASVGVAADGVQLRDNWWTHAPMPTSTVEMAYLSNPREAALMAGPEFREQVAGAIRDGIEAFDPQIRARRAQILAWEQAHPAATPHPPAAAASTAAPPVSSFPAGAVLALLTVALAVAAILTLPAGSGVRRRMARRRRRRTLSTGVARRTRLAPHSVYAGHSVYDDLAL
ncbi:MAG: N-acetylmuramoyl-L-alanine amidase [Candidatus Dormibacteraeota bacterium]|nr:N-acetylmuramoyl-L-alanine amidase [Candidatus Dormibacteraeota bacterium]MBV9525524.1 N-acetylmuramoyl-L-alanine amidase [Candidatus Dormibacteraeota bacterium]